MLSRGHYAAGKARNLRHIPVEFHQGFLRGDGTKILKNRGDGGMWNKKLKKMIDAAGGVGIDDPAKFRQIIAQAETEFQTAWETYQKIRK